DVSVVVAEDLDLQVARTDQVLLQEEVAAPERGGGFLGGGGELLAQLPLVERHAHPAPAAAERRLEDGRITDARRRGRRRLHVRQRVRRAGNHGDAQGGGGAARLHLVAHLLQQVRGRANEDQAGVRARLRERGVLGEEAVARVDRLRAVAPRQGHD